MHALVSRGRGRVQYWQCENEPSNTDLLWAGTAGEYVAHLRTFHRARALGTPRYDAAAPRGVAQPG